MTRSISTKGSKEQRSSRDFDHVKTPLPLPLIVINLRVKHSRSYRKCRKNSITNESGTLHYSKCKIVGRISTLLTHNLSNS